MKTKYVIISPVRNEQEYIEKTIQSVISQSNLPLEWVIVNDGSSDRTADIVERYSNDYDWIKLINLKNRGYYFPGPGVIHVFYEGFNSLSLKDWEFIVKLDCDLSFAANYFEKILNEFKSNNKLGIASGATFLQKGNSLCPEKTQEDHPVGPSKIYRKECFMDIGGLKCIPGWDLADIIQAQMKGWETKCFQGLKIIHYRQTGTRRKGITGGKCFLGTVQYRLGYSLTYTVLKAFYKLFEFPYILGSIGIISGYISAYLRKDEKYLDSNVIKYLREKHRKYILSKILFWKS